MIDRAPPIIIAQVSPEHVQHSGAAWIRISVKDRVRVRVVLRYDRMAVSLLPGVVVLLLVSFHIKIQKIVMTQMVLVPQSLKIGGETLIKPDVGPRSTSNLITKPLMCEFMRLQPIARLIQFCPRIVDHIIGLRSGADVLHAATEISRHRLSILCIGVLQASLF